jgi:hypothetical protein
MTDTPTRPPSERSRASTPTFPVAATKFEVGQTYTATGEIVACKNGFHAIPEDQHPLAVFNYYPPAGSRFCIVELGGKTDSNGDKVAAEILSVGLEVGLREHHPWRGEVGHGQSDA